MYAGMYICKAHGDCQNYRGTFMGTPEICMYIRDQFVTTNFAPWLDNFALWVCKDIAIYTSSGMYVSQK
jgi:hypothetical protein